MRKSILVFTLCGLCCLLLALYSAAALSAAREGFYLWRDHVFPALLPFFVCAHIMQHCGAITDRGRLALYGLSMLSGAPAGARLSGSFGADVTDTAAALNAVSPMFICGSFAAGMLNRPALAWPILLAQFLSAAIFLLLAKDEMTEAPAPAAVTESPSFLRLLSEALASGVASLFTVGGAIMVFMAFQALLEQIGLFALLTDPLAKLFAKFGLAPELPAILLSGMLEMVQGCQALAVSGLNLRQTATIAAFFFSFGGVCVLAQSLTVAKLRAGRYLWRKLLQGGLAGLLAYLFAPLFLPDAQEVFSSLAPDMLAKNALSAALTAGISMIGVSVVLLLGAVAGRKSGAS